MQEIREFL